MKKHRNMLVIAFFLCVIIALWLGLSAMPRPELVRLDNVYGVHDLRNQDLAQVIYYSKDYWDAYPDKLYTPEDFAQGLVTEAPCYEEMDYSVTQYATHRLILRLPPGKTYGISMPTSDYAMRIYIDGVEKDCVGLPAASKEKMIPRVQNRVYYITPQTDATELVVQASNFVHREGAWYPSFYISEAENITLKNTYDMQMTYTIMGALLAMSLYHMGIFLLNRSRKNLLVFSLACLILALFTKSPLQMLFPNYNWYVAIRVEYIIFFLAFAALAFFTDMLFPKLLHRPLMRGFYALTGLFILLDIVLTPKLSSQIVIFYQIAVGLVFLYILVALALSSKKGGIKHFLAFVGLLIVSVFALNDILLKNGYIFLKHSSGQLLTMPIGMLFFVFCYALVISIEYAETDMAMQAARESEQHLALENAALDRVNRMKSALMENLTHELRTPLTVMSVYAQLAVDEIREKDISPQAAEDLTLISSEAKRLAELASDTLQVFSDREAHVGLTPFSIETVIRQVGRITEPLLQQSNNTLTLDIAAHLPLARGRAEECTQLIWNLLSNAARHTEDGEIVIRVATITEGDSGQEMLAVALRDTGPGIPPAFLPHVFERHNSNAEGGAGLGLSICKEIVEAHGGSITAENGANGGTTMRFTLPIADGGEPR